MSLPDIQTLYGVVDATWPAAKLTNNGPFTLRQGEGGGSRVSAATANSAATDADVDAAAQAMIAMGQDPLFMIRAGDEALDSQLDAAGYTIMDPVSFYVCAVDDLCAVLPPKTAFPAWPPLAAQREIWAAGGVGPRRLDVMARASEPKTAILGRTNDCPAGTVFVALDGPIAMLHALEISADYRRRGLARGLTIGCANWARDNGATHLSLITTQANAAANALYASLGMTVVGHYHYRIKPEPLT